MPLTTLCKQSFKKKAFTERHNRESDKHNGNTEAGKDAT